MFKKIKESIFNFPSMLELVQYNTELMDEKEELMTQNMTLMKENQELREESFKFQQDYLVMVSVANELLAKLNNYQSFSSQANTKSENPFIAKFTSLSESEKEQERKKILSCHCPCPVTEDENNVVIRYLMVDESFSRIPPLGKNNIPWTEKLIIEGGRYQLFIQLDVTDERTWEIGLVRDGYCIPKGYRLKAVTDKDENFEGNEVIATGDTQDIYLSLEMAVGEGLKFEIYPEPDDYLASRIFWFY